MVDNRAIAGVAPKPIEMSDEQKREALRVHVLGMLENMNRAQRRAFVAVANKTKDLNAATEAAIKRGWFPGARKVKV